MATATATRAEDDRAAEKEKAAKAKEKERAAKQKDKERAAKAKEKERLAKQKDKERAAKQRDKERAAKAKEKERLATQKQKERLAAQKEKDKAAKAKEKERAAKAKEKERAAKAEEGPGKGPRGRGGSTRPARSAPRRDGSSRPAVHEAGWVAEELGKASAVTRSTKRPSRAASYTTRDHDVIRRWAESRGGVPADVRGTGDGSGAGVLRIEFRDEADRLEDVSWDAFFATFDDSDVDFLYQEHTKDGGESRFHKIVRADA